MRFKFRRRQNIYRHEIDNQLRKIPIQGSDLGFIRFKTRSVVFDKILNGGRIIALVYC